jgi:phosphatidate cytidylyltransferase
MKRVATALVLVPVVVWTVLAGPEWALMVLLAATGLIAFHEFNQIAVENRIASPGPPGMIAGLALMFAPEPQIVVVLVALAGLLLAVRVPELSQSMAAAAAFTLGVTYIFGSWRCAIDLHAIDHNWLMFALLLSWVGDTAALYVGRAFGRHKLAPRLSPKKTWEGAIASLVAGAAAGTLYMWWRVPVLPWAAVLGVAVAGNVAGQFGDLCESAMKRGAGVKDSGTSLPGHGGWLDRIDSTLFSVPVVYGLVKWLVVCVTQIAH